MELKIGIGLDNIQLGINEDKLKHLIGEPDKINHSGIEIEDMNILYYNSIKTKFKFDVNEHRKLFSIETFNPDVKMFDKKIIGKSKNDIKKLFKDKHVSIAEEEDFVTFETLHSEQISASFMFEFDQLISIEIYPLFIDEDTIQWPN